MPGFLALRVIESSNSVSPAEIRLKKESYSATSFPQAREKALGTRLSYSAVAKDVNDENVLTLRQADLPRGRKVITTSSGGKQFTYSDPKQFLFV